MSADAHEVQKMVGIYKKLFIFLATITAVGIAVVYLHLPVWSAVVLGLLIITIKAKIVLDSFKQMLKGRYGLVILFGLTAAFFVTVIILPLFNHEGYLVGTVDLSKQIQMDEKPTEGHHHGN